MTSIQYSIELLKDFYKLMMDFVFFMTYNLIHADLNLPIECQKIMSELIKFSLDNSRQFLNLFKSPLLNYERHNKEVLMKNIGNFVIFFNGYLDYAGPRLQQCRPDIYQRLFVPLANKYIEFRRKYSI